MSDKRILEILEEIKTEQTEQKVEITEIRKDLSYHIRRTDVLEDKSMKSYEFYMQTMGVIKFLGLLALLIGIITGISQIV